MKIMKLSAVLFCSSSLLASACFANEVELSANLTGYDLLPHTPNVFTGNWFNTRVLHCKVRAEKYDDNPLIFEVKSKRVVINGVILREGHSMSLTVKIGQAIDLEVDTRGKFSITNDSDYQVNLRCN